MAGEHLTNDEFFTRLTTLFDANRQKGHGTIYLTQKRLTYSHLPTPSPETIANDPLWDTYHPEEPVPVLIRATNNPSSKRKGTDRVDREKTRISTVVQPGDIDAFYAKYAECCRAGMTGLKKRDRKKGKKDKKKKKAGAPPAAVETKG